MSGAPLGNQNAIKARRWAEALKRALSRNSGDIDKGLDAIATKIVAFATEGVPWAIEHIADRLDGRPKQTLEAHIEHNVNVGSSDSLAPALTRAVEVRTKSTVQ